MDRDLFDNREFGQIAKIWLKICLEIGDNTKGQPP